jgi:16S rRNA C1402 N4-methylase RsmH
VEISEAELVNHLKSAEIHEGELLKQRLKAMDNRTVFEIMSGSSIENRIISPVFDTAQKTVVEVVARTMAIDERQQKKINLITVEDEDENDFEDYGNF